VETERNQKKQEYAFLSGDEGSYMFCSAVLKLENGEQNF
jgi:hypothetical protein